MDTLRIVVLGADTALSNWFFEADPSFEVMLVDFSTRTMERLPRLSPAAIVLAPTLTMSEVFSACEAIRNERRLTSVHLLALRPRGASNARAEVLAGGADDTVAYPLPIEALTTHLKSSLRRHRKVTLSGPDAYSVIRIGQIKISAESYAVEISGKHVNLTAGEFRLLWRLAENAGKVLPASELLGDELLVSDAIPERTVRTRVSTLRQKLGVARNQIQTHRYAGYSLTE